MYGFNELFFSNSMEQAIVSIFFKSDRKSKTTSNILDVFFPLTRNQHIFHKSKFQIKLSVSI